MGFFSKTFIQHVKPKLNIFFESTPTNIKKGNTISDNSKIVEYVTGDTIKRERFDHIISCIGFIPNKIEIETSKPIYYVGWCNIPKGNIGTAMIDAKEISEKIVSEMTFKY